MKVSSCQWKTGLHRTEPGDHRIASAGLHRPYGVPAELDRTADDVGPAPGPGDELGAKADAEHRPVARPEIAEQRKQAREPGAFLIGERVLLAPQHHHGIVFAGIVGKRRAEMRLAEVDLGPRLPKRHTDEAGRRRLVVLDDEYAHETSCGRIRGWPRHSPTPPWRR